MLESTIRSGGGHLEESLNEGAPASPSQRKSISGDELEEGSEMLPGNMRLENAIYSKPSALLTITDPSIVKGNTSKQRSANGLSVNNT